MPTKREEKLQAQRELEAAQTLQAGDRLRQLRESLRMTGKEVQRKTDELGYEVLQQQVQHLEAGDRDRPSMRDLVVLGRVYGLTPNQMAELFGYWKTEIEAEDWRITMAKNAAKGLTERQKDLMFTMIGTLASMFASGAIADH